MDLVLTLPILLIAGPVMLLVALLVWMGDKGPIIFSQPRCGAGGKLFSCLKFRTMRVDAEARLQALLKSDPDAAAEWAKFQKLRNDPRVTPIGRFLRKTSLDELPQLLNILRGEMSVIGPRPITSGEIHRYGSNFDFYTAARPGVLGLWQVSGRNTLTYEQRVLMDIEYVRTWTIWKDVKILLRAIPVVLLGLGAY